MSKRDQRVTQWMSVRISTDGRSLNSSHESSRGCSTAPEVRNVQVAKSARPGIDPACSTGHLAVAYWPGGSRSGSTPIDLALRSAVERNNPMPYGSPNRLGVTLRS